MGFNPDEVYRKVEADRAGIAAKSRAPAIIRLWDGNWAFLGYITGECSFSFEFLLNDVGSAEIVLPYDHVMCGFFADHKKWPTKSLYLTFDKDGARWSGRIEHVSVEVNYTGDRVIRISALHNFNKLKQLLVWANPFLDAAVQFPKAFYLFGPTAWALSVALESNLLRKNNALWELPDDPMNPGQWFQGKQHWPEVVKPLPIGEDNSLPTVIASRFKSFFEVAKEPLAAAQVYLDCRRYLPEDGDPPPIPGVDLSHGCLVFEFQNKSGWNRESSWWGNMTQGLRRAFRRITSDGMDYEETAIPRVDSPAEYKRAGWFGSLPEAPWVVLEEGDATGVESTTYGYTPPGPVMMVTGGSSMPGVNEAIKASIIGVVGALGFFLGGQTQLGSVVATVAEPLYSDVFLAFNSHKIMSRVREHGWDYPFEYWADGADKAFTLKALSAILNAKQKTEEKFSFDIKISNGCPYFVGAPGYGDFFIGDRVAVHPWGFPKDMLRVLQVSRLKYQAGDGEPGWEITIGDPDFKTGFAFLADRFERHTGALQQLGVW